MTALSTSRIKIATRAYFRKNLVLHNEELSLGGFRPTFTVSGTMASAEREPITGVWRRSPQRGQVAEPLVRGSGGEAPWSWWHFYFQSAFSALFLWHFALVHRLHGAQILLPNVPSGVWSAIAAVQSALCTSWVLVIELVRCNFANATYRWKIETCSVAYFYKLQANQYISYTCSRNCPFWQWQISMSFPFYNKFSHCSAQNFTSLGKI